MSRHHGFPDGDVVIVDFDGARGGQVVKRLGVTGRQRDGATKARHRLVKTPDGKQHHAEAIVGLGEIGIVFKHATIGDLRLEYAFQGEKRRPQVDAGLGLSGRQSDGAAEGLEGMGNVMPSASRSAPANDIGRETAKILLDIEAVNFRPQQPYVLTSGRVSPVLHRLPQADLIPQGAPPRH